MVAESLRGVGRQFTTIHGLAVLACFQVLLPHSVLGQDSTKIRLPTIIIQSTRQLETYATATRSVVLRQHNILSAEPGLSLQHVLRGLPGLQISERGHSALGERILVRGMGYRAAFGVRGLQAFLNGIPLTMPDGQSMLDVVDPVFIGHSEFLRGPSSLFWGNASGGVLHLRSIEDHSPLRFRYMQGTYGLRHLLLSTGLQHGTHYIHTHASWMNKDGYRTHSKADFIRIGLNARKIAGRHTVLQLALNAAIQDALSPGSLTLQQVSSNPKQADSRSVNTSAGKSSFHLQGGLTIHSQTGWGNFTATAYGIRRSLENPLTFAWSELERNSGGLYAQHQFNLRTGFRLTGGIDFRLMKDDRLRMTNNAGQRGEQILLDQAEQVSSLALFTGFQTEFLSHLSISTGIRLDRLLFKMTDRLQTNGDQSGHRNFLALSPSVGLSYRTHSLTWYANLGTAFESPTTTELINGPTTPAGWNQELGPQQTTGLEAGIRGHLEHIKLELDFALFSLRIQDRLLPKQEEDGRTWYRNGGKNRHNGAEILLKWPSGRPVYVQGVYSYGAFRFLNDPGQGLRVPGVPAHQFHFTLYGETPSGWNTHIVLEAASKMWANNANTVQSDSYLVFDLYLTHENWQLEHVKLQPFVGIQNVLDRQYVRSLVVNAFGSRYFEPAQRRSIQAGIGINL